jgi:hypothetical protein
MLTRLPITLGVAPAADTRCHTPAPCSPDRDKTDRCFVGPKGRRFDVLHISRDTSHVIEVMKNVHPVVALKTRI